MLTDPLDFPKLTMNGLPLPPQIYFSAFAKQSGFLTKLSNTGTTSSSLSSPSPSLSQSPSIEPNASNVSINSSTSIEHQISQTMHRAYHNMLLQKMQSQKSYKAIASIILEIHAMLRSLIPNRADLHNVLDDEKIVQCSFSTFHESLKHVQATGEALSMLESEYRSITTKQWLNSLMDIPNGTSSVSGENENVGQENIFQTEQYETITLSSLENEEEEGINNVHEVEQYKITYPSFLLASVAYLHNKVEVCQTEIGNFKLGHIIAPKVQSLGKEFLLLKFQEQFGNLQILNQNHHECNSNDVDEGDENSNLQHLKSILPNTQTWIEEMIQELADDDYDTLHQLLSIEEKRGEILLQNGWIDNILFRSPRSINDAEHRRQELGTATATVTDENDDSVADNNDADVDVDGSNGRAGAKSFLMPEIFWLDMNSIREIRYITRISVVGSVLALHATTVAGVNGNVLKTDPLNGRIEDCRKDLAKAMSNRMVGSQDIYERNIGDVVLDLAKVLNPSLTNDAEDTIRNRTIATLRGEEPVIKLLDNRMRQIFHNMILFNPSTEKQVPTCLRTGRMLSISTDEAKNKIDSFDTLFKQAAKREFVSKGFAFYANELAEASLLSCRTINLIVSVYGSSVLDKLFIDSCRHSNAA